MTSPEPMHEAAGKPKSLHTMMLDALGNADAARARVEELMPALRAVRDASRGQRKELAVAALAQATVGLKRLDEAATRLEAAKTLHRSAADPWITETAQEHQPGEAPAPRAGRVAAAH